METWFQKSLSIFNSRGEGRFVLKGVLLIFLVVFFLEFSKESFIRKNLNYYAKYFADKNIEKVDIAILGTSHGYSAFDPRVFEKKNQCEYL